MERAGDMRSPAGGANDVIRCAISFHGVEKKNTSKSMLTSQLPASTAHYERTSTGSHNRLQTLTKKVFKVKTLIIYFSEYIMRK